MVNDAIGRGSVKARELAKRTNIKEAAISASRNDRRRGSTGTLCTTASTLIRAIDRLLKQRAAYGQRLSSGL